MTANRSWGASTLQSGVNDVPVEASAWRIYRRPIVTLALTMPPLSLVIGFLYSETSLVHGGGGIAAVILPALLFAVLLVVFAAGRFHSHPGLTVVALVVASAGPFLVGHALNYQATKDWTYDHARRGSDPPLPEAWREYDREEAFKSYVGLVTGVDGSGFSDYFRLQASVGCPGWQGAKHYRHEVNRSGVAVYTQWSCHILYFFLAGLLAFIATKPKKNQIEPV